MSNLITVEFHGDTLFAVEVDGVPHVAVTPICQALGISADRQRDRIQRDPILSEGATMAGVPSSGGAQDTLCLRLDLVHGWLFTIEEGRVRAAVRERVLDYKRHCYAALFAHFYGQRRAGQGAKPLSPTRALDMVAEARRSFGPAAARRLWVELGLPVAWWRPRASPTCSPRRPREQPRLGRGRRPGAASRGERRHGERETTIRRKQRGASTMGSGVYRSTR